MIEEKISRFHPAFTRLNIEFTKPFLTRVFSICFRRDMFPEPPADVIRENALGEPVIDTPKIKHTSKMAMLIQAQENGNFMAFYEMANAITGGDQAAIRRVVDMDGGIAALASNQAVHSDFLLSEEQRVEVAEQQAADAQKQEALLALQSGSEAAKNLGSAPKAIQDKAEAAVGAIEI